MRSAGVAYITVGDVTLRADPARAPYYSVVNDQAAMADFEQTTPEGQRESLHTSINDEVQSLEIAAQTLVDFPDAPWDLRLALARQCWDETRHTRVFLERLVAKGGYLGEFPIINQEWGVVCRFDSLGARLAVQNRTFEGGALDVMRGSVDFWQECGDSETAVAVDGIIADEIAHAGFGNEWLKTLGHANPRVLLDAVKALSEVRRMAVALAPSDEELHAVVESPEDRALAGFGDAAWAGAAVR
jgi:uncharacterized ferritin-like protein (DUF455 family)